MTDTINKRQSGLRESSSRPSQMGKGTSFPFTVPLLLVMGAFVFYPIVRTIYNSFFRVSVVQQRNEFVGFDNYVHWFQDDRMWSSLSRSALFFLMYVPISIIIALSIAVALDRIGERRSATVYRIIYYLPVVLPAAIVFQMWVWMLDPQVGLSRSVLGAIPFIGPINFLGDPNLALPSMAAMTTWRLFGEVLILFLVGLAAIPRSLLDAARVDGASGWRTFWSVQMPLLRPVLAIVLILRLKVFALTAEPLFMTGGGPIDATTTYGLEAFEIFFYQDRVGRASAWYLMLGLITLVLAWLIWKIVRTEVE